MTKERKPISVVEYDAFHRVYGCIWMAPGWLQSEGAVTVTLRNITRNKQPSTEIVLIYGPEGPEQRTIYVIGHLLEFPSPLHPDLPIDQKTLRMWFCRTFWPHIHRPPLKFEIQVLPDATIRLASEASGA